MTLSLENISVVFSKKVALDNISVSFDSGKIHALIGENGAGKSTLASVLCGDKSPTSGQILIDKQPIFFKNPAQAASSGIILVHQRPLLAESISVKENILLGIENCIDPKRFILARLEMLAKQWAPQLKMNALVKDISADERFYTALLGALCKNPKFLILDEPSVFLSTDQRAQLYKNLQNLAKQNSTVLVITHSMAEAQTSTDTVTALAKGKIAAHYNDSSTFTKNSVGYISFESANELVEATSKLEVQNNNAISFLSFKNLTARPLNRPALFNLSFTAKSSEITLIRGQYESGLETLENVICGMEISRCSGTFILSNNSTLIHSAQSNENSIYLDLSKRNLTTAILRGINNTQTGIIPSNRTFRASNPNLSVEQILTVYYTKKNQTEYAQKLINQAQITIETTEKAKNLSGGMLQRLILARELEQNPQFLILCEPLQGLDSFAASKMCERLSEIAKQGKTVIILSSTDFPEKLCQKIYTLTDGSFINDNE